MCLEELKAGEQNEMVAGRGEPGLLGDSSHSECGWMHVEKCEMKDKMVGFDDIISYTA
jgi:hypothetical protein